MVHHCMLKEAHTISYIQQTNHEWIEGDEEETTYGPSYWKLEGGSYWHSTCTKGFTKVQSSLRTLGQSFF
jgi:hypothetical protein